MDDLPSVVNSFLFYGGIALIMVIVYGVWRLGHNSGYAEGHNDASLHKVTEYKQELEGRRVEEVHYDYDE